MIQLPYIYEDRIAQEDFNKVMKKAIDLSSAKYKKLSEACLGQVKRNYNFENYKKQWVDLIDSIVARYGSWENRKNRKNVWELQEIM